MVANFLGDLTLPAGVLGHEGSTLLVTLNGLGVFCTNPQKGTVHSETFETHNGQNCITCSISFRQQHV